jgi:hypothetical protein
MEFLFEPWPWYVSGILLGLLVPAMLWLGSSFGVSTNLDTMCGLLGAQRLSDHFKFNQKERLPNLIFLLSSVFGGYIASHFLTADGYMVNISTATINDLRSLGMEQNVGLMPDQLFNWSALTTLNGFIFLVIGGLLIGFGSRYAGGCTSGHAISGLSDLQLPSLLATIGFFAGGLVSSLILIPLIFNQ